MDQAENQNRNEISSRGDGIHRLIFDCRQWNPSKEEWCFLLSIIPSHESERIEKFHFMKDKKMNIVSYLIKRIVIHQQFDLDYDSIAILKTTHGKPYLSNDITSKYFPNWNFNISHHGEVVVYVSDPIHSIGVDVMSLKERQVNNNNKDFFYSMRNCFTSNEWKIIHKKETIHDQLKCFYQYWSLKESYIKAIGIGLGMDLQRIELQDIMNPDGATLFIDQIVEMNWKLYLYEIFQSHAIALAFGPPLNNEINLSNSYFNEIEWKIINHIKYLLPNHLLTKYQKLMDSKT